MKEYVMDPKEFHDLTKGRIHWTIRKEPTILSDGGTTGERLVVLSVTGISKENKGDIVFFEMSFGRHFTSDDEYIQALEKANAYVMEYFKKATKGAWIE